MNLLQTIILYFFVVMGVIFTCIVIVITFSLFLEARRNKKYIKFKRENIGKIFFIYGKYKKKAIEEQILPHLDRGIISFDLNQNDKIQKFGDIPRYIVEKLHDESYYNSHKKESPYILKILAEEKNNDSGNKIDAISIQKTLGREKGLDEAKLKIISFTNK